MKWLQALRQFSGVVALSIALVQAGTATGAIPLNTTVASIIAIFGIVAGVVYRGEWIHGPEAPATPPS